MSATVERVAARSPSNPRAQWSALTARFLRSSLRSGELVPALVGPILFTALFYVPLHAMMSPILPGAGGYGNFLGPLILLQAMAFVAMTGGYRAALDVAGGLDRRLATLPMHRAVPPLARICATSARSALGLAVAVTCARVVGFRLLGLPVETAIFLALTAATAVGLVVATDAIGTLVARPEVIAQALMVPQLLLGVLSTGVAPIDQFPPGLRGFVAAQPVSCLVDTLRTLAAGQPTAWIGAVGWIGGLWAVGLGLQVFSGRHR